ncbi:hypothetical protein [Streptomyces sp. NPDC002122]|uniref:hypothetical protein n=1 Tax=Streptomyces sp. NPDC002122 TaxID=3154407 RepID=UPI0033275DEB
MAAFEAGHAEGEQHGAAGERTMTKVRLAIALSFAGPRRPAAPPTSSPLPTSSSTASTSAPTPSLYKRDKEHRDYMPDLEKRHKAQGHP